MRFPFLPLLALVAACSGGEEPANNTAAPAPSPTGPPPLTPKMKVDPAPGNSNSWLGPEQDKGDPATAPYGNVLDQPVVNAPSQG